MKYVIVIVACVAEGIAYAFIGALLGWKSGGGVIPMMILFAVWGATWQIITKPKQAEAAAQPDESSENPLINKNLSEQASTPIHYNCSEEILTTSTLPGEGVDQKQDHIKQATDKNDEIETSSQGVKSDPELDTQAILLGRLEECANCDRVIGKLEYSYDYKGHVVCVQCYQRLV